MNKTCVFTFYLTGLLLFNLKDSNAILVSDEDDYLRQENIPAEVCKIEVLPNKDSITPESSCSATLVGSKLVTAYHCINKNSSAEGLWVKVSCDHGKMRSTLEINPIGSNYLKNDPPFAGSGDDVRKYISSFIDEQELPNPLQVNLVALDKNDIAVIDLKSYGQDVFKISPKVRLPNSELEIDRLLLHPEKCAIFGYGINNSFTSGNLNGAPLTLLTPKNLFKNLEMAIPEYYLAMDINHTAEGDSGGPVLCKDNSTYVIIAVNIAGTSSYRDAHKDIGSLAGISFAEKLSDRLPWLAEAFKK